MSDDRRAEPGATHFGFESVDEQAKAKKVAGVFDSVATRYDLMNDLMSAGLHRLWKAFTVRQADVRAGMRVLDIAGGTGDLARAFRMLPLAQCDAEHLPFADDSFDVVSVAFGLRNMTHKDVALAEMRRVARPGGKVLVLEFSRVWAPLAPLYDAYSFSVLPWLGSKVAGDSDSYRYLAESIRMHPPQDELARLMEQAGLEQVQWFNLTAGVCALHVGRKS